LSVSSTKTTTIFLLALWGKKWFNHFSPYYVNLNLFVVYYRIIFLSVLIWLVLIWYTFSHVITMIQSTIMRIYSHNFCVIIASICFIAIFTVSRELFSGKVIGVETRKTMRQRPGNRYSRRESICTNIYSEPLFYVS